MYNFMEKNKVGGTVSARKLGKYITKKGYELRSGRTLKGEHHFGVYTTRSIEIMRGGIDIKKGRIRMWYIL